MIEDRPIFRAVADHDLDAVRIVLENDSLQALIQNEQGNTPLHNASYEGLDEIVKLLLRYNASVDAKNTNGDTPIHVAAWHGHPSTVEILVENSNAIDDKNNAGRTALYKATRPGIGNRAAAEVLINHGARIDLNSAIRLQKLEFIKNQLSKSRLDEILVLFPDKLVVDAVQWIKDKKEILPTITLLLERGANVNGRDYADQTALMVACSDSEIPVGVVSELIHRGANTAFRRNQDNKSALELAEHFGNHAAVEVLKRT